MLNSQNSHAAVPASSSLSPMIVAKFGGTSVADFVAMSRCADIVLADPSIKLIVVSASSGVTNLLVDMTKTADVETRLNHYVGVERITYNVLRLSLIHI